MLNFLVWFFVIGVVVAGLAIVLSVTWPFVLLFAGCYLGIKWLDKSTPAPTISSRNTREASDPNSPGDS